MTANSILTYRCVNSLPCFAGGYLFMHTSYKLVSFVTEKLKKPDPFLMGAPSYQELVKFMNATLRKQAEGYKINPDQLIGSFIVRNNIEFALSKMVYHLFLGKVALTSLIPQTKPFVLLRACASNLLVTAPHIQRSKAIFFQTFFLGVISSLACEKIGFLGSLFFDCGAFFAVYTHFYDRSFREISLSSKKYSLEPFLHSDFIKGMWQRLASPITYPVSVLRTKLGF